MKRLLKQEFCLIDSFCWWRVKGLKQLATTDIGEAVIVVLLKTFTLSNLEIIIKYKAIWFQPIIVFWGLISICTDIQFSYDNRKTQYLIMKRMVLANMIIKLIVMMTTTMLMIIIIIRIIIFDNNPLKKQKLLEEHCLSWNSEMSLLFIVLQCNLQISIFDYLSKWFLHNETCQVRNLLLSLYFFD